jgi:hypothetical protein
MDQYEQARDADEVAMSRDPHGDLLKIFKNGDSIKVSGGARREFSYVYDITIGHYLSCVRRHQGIDLWTHPKLSPKFRAWAAECVGRWSVETYRRGGEEPNADHVFRGAWRAIKDTNGDYCETELEECAMRRVRAVTEGGESRDGGPRIRKVACTVFTAAYPDDPDA